ncbi:uncharacterized protein [Cardiocondyla obscurior]|uniref:uncharacterized protein n=1 Tax=Cardiocondyla obscurior TaxID=286306 RepID=UPI00396569DE
MPAKKEEKKDYQPPKIISDVLVKSGSRRPGPKSRKTENFSAIRSCAGSPPPPETSTLGVGESNSRPGSPLSRTESPCDTVVLDSLEESASSDMSIRTTASGSAKRYRRPQTPICKMRRRETDATEPSDAEEFNTPLRKKRGRPIVTGDGVEVRAIKAKKLELQRLEEEIRTAQEILNSAYDPADFRSKKRTVMAQRLEEEMSHLPPRDIVAQVLQAAQQADTVAAKSTNLNGRFVRILREAALKIQIGTDALIGKQPINICNTGNEISTENQEIQRLKDEISVLREELKTLRDKKETGRVSPSVQHESMEIEPVACEELPSLSSFPPLPQREKLPPAIRPALRGVRRVLEDGDENVVVKKPTTSTADSAKDLEAKWEKKFSSFAEEMKREMRRMVSAFTQHAASADIATGAQKNAPSANTTKGAAKGRPVPGDSVGKDDKRNKKRETKTTPPLPSVGKSSGQRTGASISASKTEGTPTTIHRPEEQKWSQVVGRKAARKQARQTTNSSAAPALNIKKAGGKNQRDNNAAQKQQPSAKIVQSAGADNTPKQGKKKSRRRIPRTAAIVLNCPPDRISAVMGEVRTKIKLSDVGITDSVKTRNTISGALLIEVSGENKEAKADALASKMKEVLKNQEDVSLSRPMKTAEIRVRDLEPSITASEVATTVAIKGGCDLRSVTPGDIRRFPGGQGSLWLRLPLAAAKKANLCHARGAQDLFLHTLAERDIQVGVAAEPYRIPEKHPCWTGDTLGSVAITWRWRQGQPTCAPLKRGERFVAVRWGAIAVVGVYLPPSGTLADFEGWLEVIGECVRGLRPRPVLVAGDFNAWSRTWGSACTRARGEALEEWAATLNLTLINRGGIATCTRPQGESVIDLTWATPAAARMIKGWRVEEDLEHLSDHRYITMELEASSPSIRGRRRPEKKWALRQLDQQKFEASITVSLWCRDSGIGVSEVRDEDPVREAEWLVGAVTDACNTSMPQTSQDIRRAAYWWSDEIAQLRRELVRRRRAVTRCRDNIGRREREMEPFRQAREALKKAIRAAKARAWNELIQALDEDPWGRAYKIVSKKLRPSAPPITEILDKGFVEEVVDTLFPADIRGEDESPGVSILDDEWSSDLDVGEDEFAEVVKRSCRGNTAPGPDGLRKKIWALAAQELGGLLREMFSACLRRGVFPPSWKEAKLILLRKEGKDEKSPSAYRPICLLDEVGKIYERIIVNRLVQHLSRQGPNLNGAQFGFREGLSTVDAILCVRAFTEEFTAQGGGVLAISIDISNAFNSLPWDRIKESLRHHRVPQYLVRVVSEYLRDRWISYTDSTGSTCKRRLYRGVPQGSVLGPLLWNLGYDAVLNTALPPGCRLVCYADDTLILAGGRTFEEASRRGEVAVQAVIGAIGRADLKVSVGKTEVLFFRQKKSPPPPQDANIKVSGCSVPVKPEIKYLGLILDGHWSFEGHVSEVARRVRERASSLRGLFPNLGGPSGGARRLYVNTVRAIALYAAPVWADALAANRRSRVKLESAFHPVAVGASRAYRTVSRAAAAVLAGIIPADLLALEYARTFRRLRAIRENRGTVTPAARSRVRLEHRADTVVQWSRRLHEETPWGWRTIAAIQPVLAQWLDMWVLGGGPSFRVTQVLSGHGCFGRYLCQIGREVDERCHHCDSLVDTAQHTLEVCPAWAVEREELIRVIGPDLTLPQIIESAVADLEGWKALSLFCDKVMAEKERAERERQGQPSGPSLSQQPSTAGSGGGPPAPPPPPPAGGWRERAASKTSTGRWGAK